MMEFFSAIDAWARSYPACVNNLVLAIFFLAFAVSVAGMILMLYLMR